MTRPALASLLPCVLASCSASPTPSVAPAPAPAASRATPDSQPPAYVPITKPAPAERRARAVELPSAPCVVEGEPRANAAHGWLGISHLYVAGVPVAEVRSLGTVTRVRLVFPEGKPGLAAIELESDVVRARGSVPTRTKTTDDVVLAPRDRALRAGWLEYGSFHVAGVSGASATMGGSAPQAPQVTRPATLRSASLEPVTELPAWVVPAPGFADAPFLLPCAELTPFHEGREDPPPDAELLGKTVVLTDDAGRAVATLDAETVLPPEKPGKPATKTGVPVVIQKSARGRTKVRFAIGPRLHGEGWVESRFVKKSSWGGLGFGSGRGRGPKTLALTCDGDVPLWIAVKDELFEWGTLRAGKSIRGLRGGDGDFRVMLGGNPFFGRPAKAGADAPPDPFVPKESLGGCHEADSPPPP